MCLADAIDIHMSENARTRNVKCQRLHPQVLLARLNHCIRSGANIAWLPAVHAALYSVYTMKQTWRQLRAHVVHLYIEYVCFMLASSCKRGICLLKQQTVSLSKKELDPQIDFFKIQMDWENFRLTYRRSDLSIILLKSMQQTV